VETLSSSWRNVLDVITFAFQPIVDIRTHALYGVEALLRGWDRAGYTSIQAVFDAACADEILYAFDLALRKKALLLFASLPLPPEAKLFYNLDNRVVDDPQYSPGNTLHLLEEAGLKSSRMVFEISEQQAFSNYKDARSVLSFYKKQNFRIALDDFGIGYSGLQLLYYAEPDIVKIDRFFIGAIDQDPRKRLFVSQIVTMAHLMGLSILAEGVENEREFDAARRIGCDLVQGYFISVPLEKGRGIVATYPSLSSADRANRRYDASGAHLARAKVSKIEPLYLGGKLEDILARFKEENAPNAIPVLNQSGGCEGLFREKDFRRYVYSPFGISLLGHAAAADNLAGLVVKAPVVDGGTELGAMKDLFLGSPEADGVIVMENGRYLGLLDARSILAALAEKELQEARDQNPLSRLPGNGVLESYFSHQYMAERDGALLVYFDFNDFKPYNDRYGFRRGDRVIRLFADILRELAPSSGNLVIHIGGDDFFAKISWEQLGTMGDALLLLEEIQRRFAGSVSSFYDDEDRARGYILGKDRSGHSRHFPFLTVCAGAIALHPNTERPESDLVCAHLAQLKRRAKEDARRVKSKVPLRSYGGLATLEAQFCKPFPPGKRNASDLAFDVEPQARGEENRNSGLAPVVSLG